VLELPETRQPRPTGWHDGQSLARCIPKGMTVEYLAKAKSSVTAIADGSDEGEWLAEGDKIVPVDLLDAEFGAV
jgi:hypothetical protein